jgi:hypothetical protein
MTKTELRGRHIILLVRSTSLLSDFDQFEKLPFFVQVIGLSAARGVLANILFLFVDISDKDTKNKKATVL